MVGFETSKLSAAAFRVEMAHCLGGGTADTAALKAAASEEAYGFESRPGHWG